MPLESSAPETSPAPPAEQGGEIVARAGRYYRWTRYLISVGLLMGYGSLFFRDGFITWPKDRERAALLESQGRRSEIKEKPRSDLDIKLNQVIGLTVPPLGLALLVWTLYNSRGQYRLAGHTLYVPGHPPVPLDAIRQIDKTLWEKKGIAYIDYELLPTEAAEKALPGAGRDPESGSEEPGVIGYQPQTDTGRIKLDDFVYEQEKTDAILDRIEQTVAPPAEDASAEGAPPEDAPAEAAAEGAEGAAQPTEEG